MRIGKLQTAIITALNLVIAALATVILLVPTVGASNASPSGGSPVTDPTEPEVHNKFREASKGRIAEIERETRLMGTGDERVVNVFFVEGNSYIFGNATVGDLDFDSYGGFLCIADSSGRLTAFTYFDGNITAVGAVGDGFAVGTADASSDNRVCTLRFVGYDGSSRDVAPLDGDAVCITVKDDGKVAVVTQPNANTLKLTEYTVTETAWQDGKNTRISGGFAYEFFDCYLLGNEYIIAARASSLPRYDSLVFYTLEAGGDATSHFYGGTGDSMLQPYAVLPQPNGYLALCRRSGNASVVTVDYSFMSMRRDILGYDFQTASLAYVSDKYYACFKTEDGTTVYEIDSALNRHVLTCADGLNVQCAFSSGGAMLVGESGDGIKLLSVDGKRMLELDAAAAIVYGGTKNTDGTTTVVLSAVGGTALSEPSGGRDIYIVTIRV